MSYVQNSVASRPHVRVKTEENNRSVIIFLTKILIIALRYLIYSAISHQNSWKYLLGFVWFGFDLLFGRRTSKKSLKLNPAKLWGPQKLELLEWTGVVLKTMAAANRRRYFYETFFDCRPTAADAAGSDRLDPVEFLVNHPIVQRVETDHLCGSYDTLNNTASFRVNITKLSQQFPTISVDVSHSSSSSGASRIVDS